MKGPWSLLMSITCLHRFEIIANVPSYLNVNHMFLWKDARAPLSWIETQTKVIFFSGSKPQKRYPQLYLCGVWFTECNGPWFMDVEDPWKTHTLVGPISLSLFGPKSKTWSHHCPWGYLKPALNLSLCYFHKLKYFEMILPSLWLNSWRGAMEGERERERWDEIPQVLEFGHGSDRNVGPVHLKLERRYGVLDPLHQSVPIVLENCQFMFTVFNIFHTVFFVCLQHRSTRGRAAPM